MVGNVDHQVNERGTSDSTLIVHAQSIHILRNAGPPSGRSVACHLIRTPQHHACMHHAVPRGRRPFLQATTLKHDLFPRTRVCCLPRNSYGRPCALESCSALCIQMHCKPQFL